MNSCTASIETATSTFAPCIQEVVEAPSSSASREKLGPPLMLFVQRLP
ncbi:MAG: hypothetical protein ACREEM_01620 [Blastocatellia bacterium]